MINESSVAVTYDQNSSLDMDIDSVYADHQVPEAMEVMANSDSDSMDSGDDEPIIQVLSKSGNKSLITVFESQLKIFSFTTWKSTTNGLPQWPQPSNAV